MKKQLIAIILVIAFMCSLAACQTNDDQSVDSECQHNWTDANCESPKKCSICGLEEGDPVHDYDDPDWGEIRCKKCNERYKEIRTTPYRTKSVKITERNFDQYFEFETTKNALFPSAELILKNPDKYVGWKLDSFIIEVRYPQGLYRYNFPLGGRERGLIPFGTPVDKSEYVYYKYAFDDTVKMEADLKTPIRYDEEDWGEIVTMEINVVFYYKD